MVWRLMYCSHSIVCLFLHSPMKIHQIRGTVWQEGWKSKQTTSKKKIMTLRWHSNVNPFTKCTLRRIWCKRELTLLVCVSNVGCSDLPADAVAKIKDHCGLNENPGESVSRVVACVSVWLGRHTFQFSMARAYAYIHVRVCMHKFTHLRVNTFRDPSQRETARWWTLFISKCKPNGDEAIWPHFLCPSLAMSLVINGAPAFWIKWIYSCMHSCMLKHRAMKNSPPNISVSARFYYEPGQKWNILLLLSSSFRMLCSPLCVELSLWCRSNMPLI